MSLVACAECGRQISDKAANCPQCGAPVAPAQTEPTVTTQLTSKKFKLQKLIAVVMVILGTLVAIIPESSGAKLFGGTMMLVGVALFILARTRAWWHSG